MQAFSPRQLPLQQTMGEAPEAGGENLKRALELKFASLVSHISYTDRGKFDQ